MDNTRHWHERYRLTFGKRRGTLFDQKTVRWEDLVHQRTSYPLWSNDEQ